MRTRLKQLLAVGIPTVLLILFAVVYFFVKPGFLDRSGLHETNTGAVQYRDYYGRPMTGWQEIDGFWYYFNEQDCAMYTGWMDIGDDRIYLNENGHLAIGWEDTDLGRRYFDKNGILQTGWFFLDGSYYYLDASGVMQTGLIKLNDTEHFLTDSGAAYTGWLEQDGCKYYYDDKGVRQTGWVNVDGVCYYFDQNGVAQTGWTEIDGSTYFLTDSSTAHTGWLEQDGLHYFFDNAGVMQTGWILIDDIRYYLQEDGAFATGTVTVDGIERYFTADGEYIPLVNPWNAAPDDYTLNLVWFEDFLVDAACRKSLQRMFLDCRVANYPCKINSAYRSYDEQEILWYEFYNTLVAVGYSQETATKFTNRQVAIPGTSEHHTGLAVDISGTYNTYGWLARNSWRYGFIMRYPEGKTSVTGIIYEPWHFRYVGKEVAKAIYESGLTLEEWLENQKS